MDMMIFYCQSCGEPHTMPGVTSANITICAKCGGQSFATWQPRSLQPSADAKGRWVPEEPTEEMLAAAFECMDNNFAVSGDEGLIELYKAMLKAASPLAPQQEVYTLSEKELATMNAGGTITVPVTARYLALPAAPREPKESK